MKADDWTYDLHISGTRPRQLPLEDFGELVKRLSDLLGCPQDVRFAKLKSGSASILARVLPPSQHAVQVNVMRAKAGEGSASKVTRIDDYLAQRGWHGELRNREGRVLVVFPGALAVPPAQEVKTVQQADAIIGEVVKIGGRDDTVPMQVRTLDGHYLDVTVKGRDLAKKLGALLFQEIRIEGTATWQRNASGEWSCVNMAVTDFDTLSDMPLPALFDAIREQPGNDWNKVSDPEDQWLQLRRGEQ